MFRILGLIGSTVEGLGIRGLGSRVLGGGSSG